MWLSGYVAKWLSGYGAWRKRKFGDGKSPENLREISKNVEKPVNRLFLMISACLSMFFHDCSMFSTDFSMFFTDFFLFMFSMGQFYQFQTAHTHIAGGDFWSPGPSVVLETRNLDYETTELGYRTSPNACRGGNRFVKGGFKKLTKKALISR